MTQLRRMLEQLTLKRLIALAIAVFLFLLWMSGQNGRYQVSDIRSGCDAQPMLVLVLDSRTGDLKIVYPKEGPAAHFR